MDSPLSFLALFSNANSGGSWANDKFYGVVAGNSFAITSSDTITPVPVTILLSDTIVPLSGPQYTTASLLANRINTTLGINVASNDNGILKIQTIGVGSDATLTLSDITAGIIYHLNFTSVIYTSITVTGSDAIRGVVTTSLDSKGGIVPLKWFDGSSVITEPIGELFNDWASKS